MKSVCRFVLVHKTLIRPWAARTHGARAPTPHDAPPPPHTYTQLVTVSNASCLTLIFSVITRYYQQHTPGYLCVRIVPTLYNWRFWSKVVCSRSCASNMSPGVNIQSVLFLQNEGISLRSVSHGNIHHFAILRVQTGKEGHSYVGAFPDAVIVFHRQRLLRPASFHLLWCGYRAIKKNFFEGLSLRKFLACSCRSNN